MRPVPPSFEAIHFHDRLLKEQIRDTFAQRFHRTPRVSLTLAAVIVIVHFGLALFEISLGAGLDALFNARATLSLVVGGGRVARLIEEGETWRMLSCMWVHGDLAHLLLNGVALYGLGRICEALHGAGRTLFLFLAAVLGGSALSHLGGADLSVGASGGVFGLMGACIVFGWRFRKELPDNQRRFLLRGIAPWVPVNLLIGAVPWLRIDNLGHLGGLFAGAALAFVLGNDVVPGRAGTARATRGFWLASAALVVWAVSGWVGFLLTLE